MFDVIIPLYNSPLTIASTISSAWKAGASGVIVVDDGSTDDSADIAEASGATVLRQKNLGPAKARLRGAQSSSADYVVFLDSDDELLEEGVQKSLTILSMDSSLAAAGGGVIGIFPDGRSRQIPRTYNGYFSAADLIHRGYGPWPPGAAVIRLGSLLHSTQMNITALGPRYAEDFEMFLRLSATMRIYAHAVPSLRYSMYTGRSSQRYLEPILDEERLRRYYARELCLPYTDKSRRELGSISLLRAMRTQWARGRYVPAVVAGGLALSITPVRTMSKTINRLSRLHEIRRGF